MEHERPAPLSASEMRRSPYKRSASSDEEDEGVGGDGWSASATPQSVLCFKRVRASSVSSSRSPSPSSDRGSSPHSRMARRREALEFQSLVHDEDTNPRGFSKVVRAESSPSDIAELCSALMCNETLGDQMDALELRTAVSPVQLVWSTLSSVHTGSDAIPPRHRRRPSRPLFDSNHEISVHDVFPTEQRTQPLKVVCIPRVPFPVEDCSCGRIREDLDDSWVPFPEEGGCSCGKTHEGSDNWRWDVYSPTPPPGFDPASGCCASLGPDSEDDTEDESPFDA
ncbi:hypothetical protein FI667_g2189, partial [Globisporangium splendens]